MDSLNGFRLTRKTLADVLKQAAKVTERRNSIPILSNVLFAYRRDAVTVTATDLDLYLSAELPAACEAEGSFTVPLATLKDAVGKLKGEFVTLADLGGCKAVLTCETSGVKVTLPTLPADDWPEMKRGEMLSEFALPAATFASAIASALPFTSTEETRYYLIGVYMHGVCLNPPPRTAEHEAVLVELAELREAEQGALKTAGPPEGRSEEAQAHLETVRERVAARSAELRARANEFEDERMRPDSLRFAATDGHRLGRVTLPMPEGAAAMPDVIIPTKACRVLGSIMGKKPDGCDVRVSVNGAKVLLRYGRFALLTKVIDGTFPDYGRVIPSADTHRITVPAAAFSDAVESVAAVASEKTRAVAISATDGEPIVVTCTSPENGKAAVCFEGGDYQHADGHNGVAIGFNSAYLKGILALFPGDVTFTLSDCAAPTLIESPDRPELTVVLMPMRVDGSVMTRADVENMNASPRQDPAPQDPARLDQAEAVPEPETAEQPGHVANDNAAVSADPFDGYADPDDFVDAPAEPESGLECAPVEETGPVEPETVAAEGRVADQSAPAAQPVDMVKVLTLTDQAVFVSRVEWENPVQRVLQRFTRDGSQMGERVILRTNIKRLVPPRNRGDRPIAAAMPAPAAQPVESDVAERLARLERIVAGSGASAAPAASQGYRVHRSAAHVRSIRAYLQLRAKRAQLLTEHELVDRYAARLREASERASLAEAAYAEAKAARATLQVRCTALERLHADSVPLDTAAAGLNGHAPAIVLPAVRTSARVG